MRVIAITMTMPLLACAAVQEANFQSGDNALQELCGTVYSAQTATLPRFSEIEVKGASEDGLKSSTWNPVAADHDFFFLGQVSRDCMVEGQRTERVDSFFSWHTLAGLETLSQESTCTGAQEQRTCRWQEHGAFVSGLSPKKAWLQLVPNHEARGDAQPLVYYQSEWVSGKIDFTQVAEAIVQHPCDPETPGLPLDVVLSQANPNVQDAYKSLDVDFRWVFSAWRVLQDPDNSEERNTSNITQAHKLKWGIELYVKDVPVGVESLFGDRCKQREVHMKSHLQDAGSADIALAASDWSSSFVAQELDWSGYLASAGVRAPVDTNEQEPAPQEPDPSPTPITECSIDFTAEQIAQCESHAANCQVFVCGATEGACYDACADIAQRQNLCCYGWED